MKLFAPKYYGSFKCIADKCEHSCCIGWEIDIDDTTLKKYESLNGGYGDNIKSSISTGATPHFILSENDRCPHLDGSGLCKIITNLGEEYLCDICREHPRFYNYTKVAEVGIGMSCPEASRVILSSPDYAVFENVGSVNKEADAIAFDGIAEREAIYEILGNKSIEYTERLQKIYDTYSVEKREDAVWLEVLDSLEYLDVAHKALFMNYSSKNRTDVCTDYLERFLAYIVFRHCTEAIDLNDFRARLGFSLFCESLLCALIFSEKAKTLHEIAHLASIISEEIEYSEDNTFALTY